MWWVNNNYTQRDRKTDLFLWFPYLHQSLYLLSLVLSKSPSETMAEPPFQLPLYNPENFKYKSLHHIYHLKLQTPSKALQLWGSVCCNKVQHFSLFGFPFCPLAANGAYQQFMALYLYLVHLMLFTYHPHHNKKNAMCPKWEIFRHTTRRELVN